MTRLVALLLVLSACKEGDTFPFSIELSPQTVTRDSGEMFEATLTVRSRSDEYANETVQVDVVQLAGAVIDELTEGDVNGMVDGFSAVDPDMSGLGVRWKRMSWTLNADAPSRQRNLTWVCDEGTTAVLFFVTVNGQAVGAPTGSTWRAIRSDSSLEPTVADVIERELGLTPERELEVLPVGCGEDPDAGPRSDGGMVDADAGDAAMMDGGGGGERQVLSGFDVREYGIAHDGTIWFTAGNPGQDLYRVAPSTEEAVQRTNTEVLSEALGTTVTSYGISQLSVSADGAAILRVQTDADNCLMIARSTSWTPILCEGDLFDDGPAQNFNQWAVVADDTVGFLALVGVRIADIFRVVWIVNTGSDVIASEVVRAGATLPGLATTSPIEIIDSLVVSTSGVGGFRAKAFDGTIAVYSDDTSGPALLAWMDVRGSPPDGSPVVPPTDVNISAYSFGNRAIDGLTVNANGTFAWVMKVITTEGLQEGSGIYVSQPEVRRAIALPGVSFGTDIASGASALPAVQYALADDDSLLVNGRWVDTLTDTPEHSLWVLDADDVSGVATRLVRTGADAPGREPGTTLGAGIELASMGPMVASADGTYAFAALLAGPGVDETNHGAIFANSGEGLVLLARFGDEIDLGAPTPLDVLDMASTAVRVPPLPLGDDPLAGDFLVTDVRDIHVVHGAGSDGRGSNFANVGCGIPLLRAGSFLRSSENQLVAVPLPGICL